MVQFLWLWVVLGVVTVTRVNYIRCQQIEPTTTVEQGKLRGAIRELLDGTPYYSFKGIPYAQPPVGNLRFMAPLTPKPWQGTYNATEHGPKCTQYEFMMKKIIEGDEMCLFLNVYTKSIQPESKIPVMVFIHGGGFSFGSGDEDDGYGPEFLLQHDVILVTINYRLEVLGFLCLDTPEVPGNAGMKDQVAALRWVKNNIAKFGGDPDNITIFGESAGSASVTYHLHSRMSKGLFHKAIAESGVSLNDWAEGRDAIERAFRVGKVLGNDTRETAKLLEFLRSLPAVELVKLTFPTMTTHEMQSGLPIHFAPVVEKKFETVEPFLTEEPIDSLLAKNINKVPLMIGYNSVECKFMISNVTNDNLQSLVPREIAQKVSCDKTKELGQRIRSFYVGNREFSVNDAQLFADMFSDMQFVYNIHRFSHFYSGSVNSVYLYRFSFEIYQNLVRNKSDESHLKGVGHAEEMSYLFVNSLNKDLYKENIKLRDIVKNVTKLWTDFAKTGNPTPDESYGIKWTPYTSASAYYFDIDEEFIMGDGDRKRIEFWNDIYCEVGLPCIAFMK